MAQEISTFMNKDLKRAINRLEVCSGTAKDSGNIYYYIQITLNNGYSKRIFLRSDEAFAWTNAFDLLETLGQVEM